MNTKLFRDGLEILPLLTLISVMKFMPLQKRIKLGGVCFSLLVRLNKNMKNRLVNNLKLTQPSMSAKDKKEFIKKFGTLAGQTFTELIFNSEFQQCSKRFHYDHLELAPLINAKKQGRPIIIVSAHLGPWEAIRAILKLHNLTAGAIYKKNKNQFYESIHVRAIKHGGEPIFPTGSSGTKRMIKHLKNGGVVALMLDQAAEDGEYFNFFGIPAKTSTSIAKLAIKLNALVVPAFAARNAHDYNISVTFEPPVKLTNYKEVTAKLTTSIESQVMLNPHQWYWLHRRWKYSKTAI